MICPHCHTEIPDTEIARHLASKGGRSLSPAKLEAVKRNLHGWPKGKPRGPWSEERRAAYREQKDITQFLDNTIKELLEDPEEEKS